MKHEIIAFAKQNNIEGLDENYLSLIESSRVKRYQAKIDLVTQSNEFKVKALKTFFERDLKATLEKRRIIVRNKAIVSMVRSGKNYNEVMERFPDIKSKQRVSQIFTDNH